MATDSKKSQLFTKLSRLITVSVREGGIDPQTNSKLSGAIAKARASNMPKNNIDRAIEKASVDAESLYAFLYEAYGPGGVAILIEGVTNNNNRTSNEIKHLLRELGLKWAEKGSVLWAFEKNENTWNPLEYSSVSISKEDEILLQGAVGQLLDHEDIEEVYTNNTI